MKGKITLTNVNMAGASDRVIDAIADMSLDEWSVLNHIMEKVDSTSKIVNRIDRQLDRVENLCETNKALKAVDDIEKLINATTDEIKNKVDSMDDGYKILHMADQLQYLRETIYTMANKKKYGIFKRFYTWLFGEK